jgi:DNA-binding transcriptional LysR family regulator
MEEFAGARRGRLCVGSASARVSADPLPQILREVRRLHENAEVSVSSGTSDQLVRQILAGELDAAFVSLPVQATGIETERLSGDELVAIAPPSHKLADKRVVTIETLGGERLILGERGGNTRRLIDDMFHKAGVRPNVVMELNPLTANQAHGRSGDGRRHRAFGIGA